MLHTQTFQKSFKHYYFFPNALKILFYSCSYFSRQTGAVEDQTTLPQSNNCPSRKLITPRCGQTLSQAVWTKSFTLQDRDWDASATLRPGHGKDCHKPRPARSQPCGSGQRSHLATFHNECDDLLHCSAPLNYSSSRPDAGITSCPRRPSLPGLRQSPRLCAPMLLGWLLLQLHLNRSQSFSQQVSTRQQHLYFSMSCF